MPHPQGHPGDLSHPARAITSACRLATPIPCAAALDRHSDARTAGLDCQCDS